MMSTVYSLLKSHAEELLERLAAHRERRIYNISTPHLALLLLSVEGPFIVVESSPESARMLHSDLRFLETLREGSAHRAEIAYLPPPLDPSSVGERVRVLREAFGKGEGRDYRIITSPEACRTGLSLPELGTGPFVLRKGLSIERDTLGDTLIRLGYRKVSVVVEKGEFSQREWLFDIYPTTENAPLRVEFFGDEIDLIKTFDIETQRSLREVEEQQLLPAEEGDLSVDLIEALHSRNTGEVFIVEAGRVEAGRRGDGDRESAPASERDGAGYIRVSHMPFAGEGIDAGELTVKGMGILPEERKGIEDIPQALARAAARTVVVLPSEAQAERLKEILHEGDVIAPVVRTGALGAYDGALCIATGRLSSALRLGEVLLLTDREIFGERPAYRPLRKSKASRLLFSIDDLKPGDFVVHKDHGIGKFAGLQRQQTDSYEEDLVVLEYASGDRLYIPFHSIGKLQKYSAGEGHLPAVDRLGGKRWLKTKQRVRERVREMADKLLRLYAERTVSRGFSFSEDTALHREFDDFFPYEETPDQAKAIEEIKKLMHTDVPMDMLICGDVGYGKTEVAVRAAFRAVYDGTQVAVLVPTTLLAEQHYRTFKTRFSGFPVKIDSLSRFRSRSELNDSVKALARGETDIVIGTHMLLNKRIQFHDLGLLIVDEEHRFGVAQKERLKELKKGVDILTLTATPIPRTLQMSLSGIRSVTTIETPPEERLAVRSVVTAFNDKTIKEAIERELGREGQVFFVHNRIHGIEKVASFIKKLAPEASIAIAHGQMDESELETVMLRFLNREITVLVSTAIIGSGIDIPIANTIIVDRADTFGLADLYQLRGRVGRGSVQAYAYFLIPGEDILTDDARKRLQAIQEMSYLGAGFRLALKDLEIRGAGNLLGPEQSGYIQGVGFDLYMEMLEKAVAELKGEKIREELEPQMRLRLSAFIPEEYITDITLRLSVYKRISAAAAPEMLGEIRDELLDRFGRLPEEVENLIAVMRMKLLAKRLFIDRVTDFEGRYRFLFVLDTEGIYDIPADFFDRLLKILFALSSSTKDTPLRFLPDGFELDLRNLTAREALTKAEELLDLVARKMNGSRKEAGQDDGERAGS
ncbi:MAG: transcription-repair coupling factor [Nitrospirota bacterium]